MKTTLRMSLNAEKFPFLYRDAHRGTILPGLDTNIRYASYYGGPDSSDWGIPQLIYCENVMPIAKGLISTQINNAIPQFAGGNTDFTDAVVVRDAAENNTVVSTAGGRNYVLNPATGLWISTLPITPVGKLITRAYTQGRTFIFYEKQALFEYVGGTLVDRTAALVFPAAFTLADVRGIGAASNYLILFTDINILWSSPSDPLNFNRALNNGSGYQIPQDLRGRISCIIPISGGAIIYSVRNAVAATFTNNAAAPFVFRGIGNSGGVSSWEQVAYDADQKYQYSWGSGGLQQVGLQTAIDIYPEVSDFLTSSIYETWNSTTKKVEQTQLPTYVSVKLIYVASRFLVISYGQSAGAYTYALIMDTALNRWGKVKKDHCDAFSYPYPNIAGDLTYAQLLSDIADLGDTTIAGLGAGILSVAPPKKSIAFLQVDGTIDVLAIDYRQRTQTGVAIIGHVQHNRNRMTTLHQVEAEGMDLTAAPHLFDLMSIEGRTIDEVRELTSYINDPDYVNYIGDPCAKTHQLCFNGAFQLTNLMIQVAVHGRAN